MILHMGVRTTDPIWVAYTRLDGGEDDAEALSRLLATLIRGGATPSDPSMILFHDPPETPGCRRELLIPIAAEVEGVETRVLPSMRVAFLVSTDAETEAHYAPSDPDEDDWTTELMIPLSG